MRIYLDNGDYIHASTCGGSTQDQLIDLARLLDEVEAGNTTAWVDNMPEYSMDELNEINEQIRAKTAQLFADLGEESKLEKLIEWANGQVDYYTSASKAGNFEEDTWGKIYHTRMVDKIDELLGESKDATI